MKAIIKLLGVRTLVTLSITGALVYGFVVGKVNAEQFMTIATMIFTFYFAKKEQEVEIEPEIKKNQQTNKDEIGGLG